MVITIAYFYKEGWAQLILLLEDRHQESLHSQRMYKNSGNRVIMNRDQQVGEIGPCLRDGEQLVWSERWRLCLESLAEPDHIGH